MQQGCQIFSYVAYGQNPDKKWPKWPFFENVMAKITKSMFQLWQFPYSQVSQIVRMQ